MDATKTIREEGLDKFYTVPSVAKKCIEVVGSIYDWNSWDLIIEPSAGNGSFSSQIPVPCKAMDIVPEAAGIEARDFFTYVPPEHKKKILVIGNPPFGRVSSLAIKFFNHAASWATAIAFIVPRTFRRISVQNRLSLHFALVHDEDIPLEPCSFSPPMQAKCCFQIWTRQRKERPLVALPTSHQDWDFLAFGPKDEAGQPTPPLGADFALRAYGGRCGFIVSGAADLSVLRPKSWHWIRVREKIDVATLKTRFSDLDYSMSTDTARQNSIGRAELVQLYSEKYD
jgi:hypothetical protein